MAAQQPMTQNRPFNNGFLPNGAAPTAPAAPVPGAAPLLPNQGRVIQSGPTRILCVADVRGNLRQLNELARAARADYIIHTGDFGFYDDHSLDRIAEKTLKHVAQYSPLISDDVRRQVTMSQPNSSIKERFTPAQLPLSQLPQFLNGTYSFDVPIYTVWGACEDVQVLEKLRSGEYKIDKLHVIDEAHSRLIEVGGVKFRLLGLGGAVVMHKLFDNGEGRTTIAGGQGTMWTTLLQMGELVDTANRVYDPSETRVLVTHASPAREGLLNQLSVHLKVDFSISAGLHFRYGSSYNEFSVNPTLDHYRGKLAASKASFSDVWDTVKGEVEPAVQDNEAQKRLLANAIDVVNKMPSVANGGNPFGGHAGPSGGQVDEMAFKNMWNFNLADAAFGWLVLEVEGGRIGTEMKAQGFNFSHRAMKNPNSEKPTAAAAAATGSPAQVPSPAPPAQAPQHPPPQPRATIPSGPAAQQQQNVATGSRQASAAHRPVPSAPASQPSQATASSAKPLQSSATIMTANGASGPSTSTTDAKPNGTPAPPDAPSRETPPPQDRKPSDGLYIQGAATEEAAKEMVPEAHRSKIVKFERLGRAFVAHFSTPEEAQEALKEVPADMQRGGPGKPAVREFVDRSTRYTNRGWGENTRSGAGSGYRSASDSEGGRGGRGGFSRGGRGGRGGAERGNERGGRGGRGGRGSFNRGDTSSPAGGTASPAPAPATGA